MGKKGSWFSAIKRVFTHNTKEKRADEPDKKSSSKEKKKGKGILRHGETKSFIPLFREPSSIEKILGEADQLLIRPPTPLDQPKSPPGLPIRPVSPRVASSRAASNRPSSPKATSPRVCSPRAVSPRAAPLRTSSTGAVSPKAAPARTFSTEDASPKVTSTRTFSTMDASPKAAPVRTLSTEDVPPKTAPARTFSTENFSSKAASARTFPTEDVPPKAASARTFSTKDVPPKAAPARTFSTEDFPPEAAPGRTFSTEDVSSKAAPKTFTTGAASSKAAPPKTLTTGAASSKATAPKVTQSRKETRHVPRPEPTLRDQQLSATKLQAAYRGYLARRSFRALKGLVRLQGVIKGQNVKRQTSNAMKQMQLLVRVQTQIQSRRIHMLENQALQHQAYKNDKEAESTLSKWTLNQLSEAGLNEDWDGSSLTKEEAEARLRKKVEAVIKRERAMAYAYSHQLWKSTPKSAQNPSDIRSNGFPWWWNWLERQLPQVGISQSPAATRNIMLTPPRPNSAYKPSSSPHPHASSSKLGNSAFDNHESITPRSSRPVIPFRAKQFQTTPSRSPLASTSSYAKYSKPKASAANSAYEATMKDDDSLVSCPPFSVPNYMTPTVSAKAKSRANSNPRERFPGTPGSDLNRRFSFPLTPNASSFKWSKGSNRDSASQTGMEKREDSRSIGDFSVDSTVSMPAALVGRRPFNRFV